MMIECGLPAVVGGVIGGGAMLPAMVGGAKIPATLGSTADAEAKDKPNKKGTQSLFSFEELKIFLGTSNVGYIFA